MENKIEPNQWLNDLPLIGRTNDVKNTDSLEYWRCIFGGIWGPVELTEIGNENISGSLRSQSVGALTFNRISFSNQLFECGNDTVVQSGEPFYSLTFPQQGAAECFVGQSHMQLVPQSAYLIKVDNSAKLRVENHYKTLNIQIPVSKLEHRLGRHEDIMSRNIVQSDAIYHIMHRLTEELTQVNFDMKNSTTRFLTNQMLDTVAFFLSAGTDMSEDTLAVRSVRTRIMAFMDANFRDDSLNPSVIASTCGISRSYLYKVFSDGPSIMEHLRCRRLEAAYDMLENRREKITMTQVAMACGFSNSSEFSRLFKKKFGTKPSEH